MQLWMELLTAAWVFYLGAAVGSFSNVVAWRMPRGIPFAAAVSRCPNCGKAISFLDNVPIFGWLILRGRCRQCRWHIPIRYFLVEVAYGLIFVLLYYVDLRFPHNKGDSPWPWIDSPRDIGRFLYHATLLSLLGICWLIHSQGDSIPKRVWWFGVIVGVGAATLFPWLHTRSSLFIEKPHWSWGLLDSLSGLAVGGLYDILMTRLATMWTTAKSPRLSACEFSLVGSFLGFYPVGVLLPLATVVIWICPLGWLPVLWATAAALGSVLAIGAIACFERLQSVLGLLQKVTPEWMLLAIIVLAFTVLMAHRRAPTTCA